MDYKKMRPRMRYGSLLTIIHYPAKIINRIFKKIAKAIRIVDIAQISRAISITSIQ